MMKKFCFELLELALLNRRSPHFLEPVHDAPVWAAFVQKCTAGFIFAASHRCIAQINLALEMSLNLSAGRMRLNKTVEGIFWGEIRADGKKWT